MYVCNHCENFINLCCDYGVCALWVKGLPSETTPYEAALMMDGNIVDGQEKACPRFEECETLGGATC